MAEADLVGVHDPLDHVAAATACSQAVPDVLLAIDDQGRARIVMDRAEPDQLLPARTWLEFRPKNKIVIQDEKSDKLAEGEDGTGLNGSEGKEPSER